MAAVSDLYALILAKLDEYDTDPPRCAGDPPWFCGAEDYGVAVRALRAVVERHKPVPCRDGNCWVQTGHQLCSTCGSGMNHPCEELLVIAEKLGIPIEGDQ